MTKKTDKAMWGGRFTEKTDQSVEAFNASVGFDQRLYAVDIAGSIAHANMLAKAGILSSDEAGQIVSGLKAILAEIKAGEFVWKTELEDVHMNIEAALTEKIGDVGKKLHTGRSRNDQVATDIRLYLREQIEILLGQISQLQLNLVNKAEQHVDAIMPGMTHLQPAQPITAAFHLMAWNEMLERDFARFSDVLKRTNISPLGSGALAGTSFPIDREMTASALGFSRPSFNALDSVSDRDFAIEYTAAASILMMHLSRMCEELILWACNQFKFVHLPDRFCTGSSIMPQKKNPDVPELIRGKTGRVYGHLNALLTLMKSQPLAYNKDNQEDKEPLFDTVDTVGICVQLFSELVEALEFNQEAMRKASQEGFVTATDLADYLVRKQIPFRDAHEIVGKAVRFCIDKNCELHELSIDEFRQFSPLITEEVYDVLTLEGSVAARSHIGGTAPEAVLQSITTAKQALKGR